MVKFKRTQREADDSSKHWYQDKYQHVLTQRNVLALVALVALVCAFFSVIAVLHFAPLKTVEPFLLQIDEKNGITQRVDPISRNDYAASVAVDRYFTSLYLRVRESYNFSILRTNYNQVRLMSTPSVFYGYRSMLSDGKTSLSATLGTAGQRDIKITSISYVTNPPIPGKADPATPQKIMQVRMTTTDSLPNVPDVVQQWVVTLSFEYASLNLNEADQLLNPLGYTVVSYQIQREVN